MITIHLTLIDFLQQKNKKKEVAVTHWIKSTMLRTKRPKSNSFPVPTVDVNSPPTAFRCINEAVDQAMPRNPSVYVRSLDLAHSTAVLHIRLGSSRSQLQDARSLCSPTRKTCPKFVPSLPFGHASMDPLDEFDDSPIGSPVRGGGGAPPPFASSSSSAAGLYPCSVCNRKFASDRLEHHEEACRKANKQRRVFDSTKQRLQGTEAASYVRKGKGAASRNEPARPAVRRLFFHPSINIPTSSFLASSRRNRTGDRSIKTSFKPFAMPNRRQTTRNQAVVSLIYHRRPSLSIQTTFNVRTVLETMLRWSPNGTYLNV